MKFFFLNTDTFTVWCEDINCKVCIFFILGMLGKDDIRSRHCVTLTNKNMSQKKMLFSIEQLKRNFEMCITLKCVNTFPSNRSRKKKLAKDDPAPSFLLFGPS